MERSAARDWTAGSRTVGAVAIEGANRVREKETENWSDDVPPRQIEELMAVREVLQFGNPLLREISADVEGTETPSVLQAMEDLKDTLHELQRVHGRGGGLAAPQVGSSIRVVYVNAKGRSFFLLNPTIVDESEELFDVWDFCFSANASFVARVRRHRRIVVEYEDENGVSHSEEFEDYFSELLQHEIDHLNGRLFVDLIERPETITMMEEFDRFLFNAKFGE